MVNHLSETSLNFQQTTRRNFPEDSHLHFRRRENLNSHPVMSLGTENRSNRSVRMAGTWPEIEPVSSVHKSRHVTAVMMIVIVIAVMG